MVNIRESLIFERSTPGKTAYSLPPLDVPAADPRSALEPALLRDEIDDFPEVSEFDIVRHFTRLSTWNYHIDIGMYPLGSCTMKYNPKLNEKLWRIPGISACHPLQDDSLAQGNLQIQFELQQILREITGMAGVSLQPAAGAHGELTGILMARAYHNSRNQRRKFVLIPDSAHGTNPASAAIAGYQVRSIPSNADGRVDFDKFREALHDDVACLMLTNPNTLGIFERRIREIADLLHEKDALLYMDGANFNALMGYTRPGEMGVDVMHLNLHKTFSTPHGGGGPGAGPVAVSRRLEPFLPVPLAAKKQDGTYCLDFNRPQSIGRVRAFMGNFGMHARALGYILSCGGAGLKEISETAVLNANYLRHRLQGLLDLPYRQDSFHEVVFSDKLQTKKGVKTLDLAKRLMDFGFHPPTIYFPLIVPGALMIEPTESEGLQELDAFVEAMQSILREAEENPEIVVTAPHTTKLRRLDETRAARQTVLRWRRAPEQDKTPREAARAGD
ncbi:MAG: aminomethyl-transferring glycine dehydrogenase subunit GcvPB [Acidobacteria bacterium]|nr:aminomethyl-transferring glycine dehydrogenase subunit GcvPB [Acidobacteriota bacterium]